MPNEMRIYKEENRAMETKGERMLCARAGARGNVWALQVQKDA